MSTTRSELRGLVASAAPARARPGTLSRAWVHVPLALVAVALLVPLWWMVVISFTPPAEILRPGLSLWTTHPTLQNYADVAQRLPLARLFLNSLIMTAGVTAGQLGLSVLAAYGFVRSRFPGRDLAFFLLVATIVLPPIVTMIPVYVALARLHGINTYWGLILPQWAGCGFGVFLLRQHIGAIPEAIFEAAHLDGAGDGYVLRRVVLPLLQPSSAALGLLVLLNTWNEYFWPLLMAPATSMHTVQTGIAQFLGEGAELWGPLTAASTVVCAPVVVAYLIWQRQIIETFVASAGR